MVVELADAFPCDITEDHLLRVARIFDEDGSGYVEQGERCPGYRAQGGRTYVNILLHATDYVVRRTGAVLHRDGVA